MMISTTRFTAADLANLDVVKRWLRTGFVNVEQRQTTLLASYLNSGEWLIVAYDLFHIQRRRLYVARLSAIYISDRLLS